MTKHWNKNKLQSKNNRKPLKIHFDAYCTVVETSSNKLSKSFFFEMLFIEILYSKLWISIKTLSLNPLPYDMMCPSFVSSFFWLKNNIQRSAHTNCYRWRICSSIEIVHCFQMDNINSCNQLRTMPLSEMEKDK